MIILKRYIVFFLLFCINILQISDVFAQCTEIESGHQIISPSSGCVPFQFEVKNLYRNATADTEYRIDWGDGTIETLSGSLDPIDGGLTDPEYTPDFTHTYLSNTSNTACGYTIIIEATNGCTLAEDARIEITVTVWDTDEFGMNLSPGVVNVCQGFAADVQFTDQSDWNCFPRAARQNDPPRFIQWDYLGGNIDVAPAGTLSPVIPVSNTGSLSDMISVPAINPNTGSPYNVGDDFVVELNNWNQCNYDDPNTAYSPDPAIPEAGEMNPVTSIGRIVIVDPPLADFQTRADNSSGVVKDVFCVNDMVYFENLTTHRTGFQYQWEFYNDEVGTDLYQTSSAQDPTLSFNQGGRKLIRLLVDDQSAVGDCEVVFEKVIKIFPVAQASILVTDASDNILNPIFCQDQSNSGTFEVKFTDNTTDYDADTRWRWEFYDENGNLIRTEPGSGSITTPGTYFTQTYVNPGVYQVKLTSWDQGVPSCTTEDIVEVEIYKNPTADFTFTTTCASQIVSLSDASNLTSVINGDHIDYWEWDFDYDGITFDNEQDYSGAIPASFDHDFGAAGNYEVGLRVTTAKGSCAATITKTVTVKESPAVSFTADNYTGCHPLLINFANQTLATLPGGVSIDEFTWYIDQGSGFVAAHTQNTADPSYSDNYQYTFNNTTDLPKSYQVKLSALTSDGCVFESAPYSIEVYPNLQTNISHNYSPLNKNCSPLTVDFEGQALAPSFSPDFYHWTIEDMNGMVKDTLINGTTPEFSFEFVNNSLNDKNYLVTLTLEKSGYCFQPSTQNISVSHIPSSEFSIDPQAETCTFIGYQFTASQNDLQYEWKINANTYINKQFSIDIEKPENHESEKSVQVHLETMDPLTGCYSTPTVKDVIIPKQEFVNIELGLSGEGEGCAPFIATFDNNSSNIPAGTEFKLLISNSGAAYEEVNTYSGDVNGTFQYLFDSAGIYQVTIQAVTSTGCTFTSSPSQVITVHPGAMASFFMDTNQGCAPLDVIFINESFHNEGDNSAWYYHEIGTHETVQFSQEMNSFQSFTNHSVQEKTYNISYVAESLYGCLDTMTQQLKVMPGVKPEFSINPKAEGCSPLNVDFDNLVIKDSVIYSWNWGDGEPNDTTTTETSISHTYLNNSTSQLKIFSMTLTATDKVSGCESKSNAAIKVYPDIESKIIPDITEGCAPVNVNVINQSLGVDNHLWYYREKGETDRYEIISSREVSYVFVNESTTAKDYEIVYEGSSKFGCKTEDRVDLTIHPEINAQFEVNPTVQTLPNSAVKLFNKTNSGDWDFEWDFGDGNGFSSLRDPEGYDYNTYGSFEIILTAKNRFCESIARKTVIIEPILPIVDFDCDPKVGCRPLKVRFENLSQFADDDSFYWDFGDNQGYSTAKNPSYTYNEPGRYTVKLEASNKIGKVVAKEKKYIIEVFDIPYVNFRIRPEKVFLPDNPVYTTNLSYGAETFHWDFGDGYTTDEFEPEYVYTSGGEYDIFLVGTSVDGCIDSMRIRSAVEVVEDGNVQIPNVFTPNPDGPNGGLTIYNNSNDIFIPVTNGVTEFHMQIFNRWGELMFESNSIERGWDGYYKGRLCPQDVYIYKLKLKYINGDVTNKIGDVTLLR